MHPRYNRGREVHGAADWQAGSILYFTKSLTSFSRLYFYPHDWGCATEIPNRMVYFIL